MASNLPETDARSPVSSLEKALRILECFSVESPELGITDISQRLELNKSTVYNVLTTYRQRGYVEQHPGTKRYRLGLQLLHLSNVVREGLSIRQVALPVMHQAKERFKETVHLTIEQDGQVVYVETVQPPNMSVARIAVGKRAHMHCTGVGKAILAFLPDEKVKSIEKQYGLPSYTANTITTHQKLQTELSAIRRQGYAIDNMEHEWGIRCIAVPIRNEQGNVFASFSISAPAERLDLSSIEEKAPAMQMMGLEISRRLGWLGY